MLARFSDLGSSNICITKIYWTKSNFPANYDFKSEEDIDKHLLAPCEGIIRFRHTLLVYRSPRRHSNSSKTFKKIVEKWK